MRCILPNHSVLVKEIIRNRFSPSLHKLTTGILVGVLFEPRVCQCNHLHGQRDFTTRLNASRTYHYRPVHTFPPMGAVYLAGGLAGASGWASLYPLMISINCLLKNFNVYTQSCGG